MIGEFLAGRFECHARAFGVPVGFFESGPHAPLQLVDSVGVDL